jgi:hypothetical protein
MERNAGIKCIGRWPAWGMLRWWRLRVGYFLERFESFDELGFGTRLDE